MGAPFAQVQSSQTSKPVGKGGDASMSLGGLSGQPAMGQPNTNGNTGLRPINPTFVAPQDGQTQSNPYPNTIGMANNPTTQTPGGKGFGGGSGGGKGSAVGAASIDRGGEFDPMKQIENTYQPNSGYHGPIY